MIGKQMALVCRTRGVAVLASTRSSKTPGPGQFFLDLTTPNSADQLPDGDGPIVILAALTGYKECDAMPALAAMVNVDAPVNLARAALNAGRRVVFVSSSSVFGGDIPNCREDDPVKPQAVYSAQKAETEQHLRSLPNWNSLGVVVRLTKVLAPNTAPLPAWRKALAGGESDFTFRRHDFFAHLTSVCCAQLNRNRFVA